MRTFAGILVLEYLEKWPDLPTLTLAKLIYNDKDNYKVFNSIEHARDIIRYYRGLRGDKNRKDLSTTKYLKHEQIQST